MVADVEENPRGTRVFKTRVSLLIRPSVLGSSVLLRQIVLCFGFLHLPGFLLLHLHSVLLLLGFIFILFSLFNFRLVRATASQSQIDSVHNFIVKVGFFFFFWTCFSCFFFFGFWKKFHVLCFAGFLLLCSTNFLLRHFSSFCSTGFLQRSAGFFLLLRYCLRFPLRKSSLRDWL